MIIKEESISVSDYWSLQRMDHWLVWLLIFVNYITN